jgi:hypothetical protein
MANEEESTGFEWLDRPFMMTRIWVTLLATVVLTGLAYQLVTILMFDRLVPRPPLRSSDGPEEMEKVRPTCCWEERHPLRELGALAGLSILPASILILVWRRPRIGFVLAAVGGLPFLMLLGFLPSAWLCFAAWKVGPATSSPAGGASLP